MRGQYKEISQFKRRYDEVCDIVCLRRNVDYKLEEAFDTRMPWDFRRDISSMDVFKMA